MGTHQPSGNRQAEAGKGWLQSRPGDVWEVDAQLRVHPTAFTWAEIVARPRRFIGLMAGVVDSWILSPIR